MTSYHLTAKQIAAMAGTRKTHFLNERARRLNKSLGDATGLTGFGFHLIEIAPGDLSTEHHRHMHEDECVFVLSGHATAHTGDDTHPIGPGDFLGYPAGGPAHSIENTGTEPLVCIVVGERREHDVGEYPRLGKRIHRHKGLPWELVEMAAIRHVDPGTGHK